MICGTIRASDHISFRIRFPNFSAVLWEVDVGEIEQQGRDPVRVRRPIGQGFGIQAYFPHARNQFTIRLAPLQAQDQVHLPDCELMRMWLPSALSRPATVASRRSA